MKKFNLAQEYADAIKKLGVESVIRHRQNMQEQILNILNPSRQFQSISDKLKDMQERAGVFKLNSVKIADKEKFVEEFNKPVKLFEAVKSIKETIIDYIDKHPHKDRPAILEDIERAVKAVASKRKDINVKELMEDENFHEFLDQLIEKTQKAKEAPESNEIMISPDVEISPVDDQMNTDIFNGKH